MRTLILKRMLWVITIVGLALALSTVLIHLIWGDEEANWLKNVAHEQKIVLDAYIDQAGNDEWLTRLNKVREVAHAEYELLPLHEVVASLDKNQNKMLERGEIVLDFARKKILRRVDLTGERYIGSDGDVLVVTETIAHGAPSWKADALRYILVGLCVASMFIVWSWSRWISLLNLIEFAKDFGHGHWNQRVEIAEEDELYPLAHSLNLMAGKITDLIQAQKNLLHSVSHELRTPISRMTFGLELLKDHTQEAHIVKRIENLQNDLDELNHLVSELLDLERITHQPKLEKIWIDLDRFINKVTQDLLHLAPNKEIQIDPSLSGVQICVNEKLFYRAFANVVKNALHYADTKISIHRSSTNQSMLSVSDDGIGIPDEFRAQVFTPFFRVDDSRARESGGYGIGLCITRNAMVSMGGDVQVEKSDMGGARFNFVFADLDLRPSHGM